MLVVNNRKRKNFDLEMIEHQNRLIIENFYKARALTIVSEKTNGFSVLN
jgi:hypothetical protein